MKLTMKINKIIFQCIIISILYSCVTNNRSQSLTAEIYYWEPEKGKEIFYPKKSTIKTGNDTIIIVDFPHGTIPNLNFRIGKFIKKPKLSIQCEIFKKIEYGMNTGQIISYTEDCDETLNLTKSKDNLFIREFKSSLIPQSNFTMKYNLNQTLDLKSHDFLIDFSFHNFENLNKKKDCE